MASIKISSLAERSDEQGSFPRWLMEEAGVARVDSGVGSGWSRAQWKIFNFNGMNEMMIDETSVRSTMKSCARLRNVH